MTHAVSPSCTSARRTPCIAIAPTVANAACSAGTPGGTGTQRFKGTQLISACSAWSFPAHATIWPTDSSSTPVPTCVTTPLNEYPSGVYESSLLTARLYASAGPSCVAVSTILCSWSGRARAMPSSESFASPTFIISVPVEINEYRERTSTPPGLHTGGGTSRTNSSPDL